MDDLSRELEQVMAERQGMYRFLARVFRKEVDRALLDEISQMDFPAATGVAEIDQGFRMLVDFVQAANSATLFDLATEYARIFLGAGSRQTGGAFPYESVYTSPRGLLLQAARDQVVEFYRQEGLQRSTGFHDPEDHIALELEFMAVLCEKTGQALAGQDAEAVAHDLQRQRDFLEKHLCAWGPRLCADVAHCAELDFYKAIAAITTGYLQSEQNLMGEF